MALACIVLGLAQTFFLNQWYWFTLFLCFGPLIGLAYGLLSPIAEAAPPANLRQLILVSYLLGMLLFVSGVIVSMVANAVTILGLSLLYEGFVLLLNSYLLGLIRVTRLGLDFKEFVNPPVLSMFWAGFVSSIRDDGHDL